MAPNIKLYFFPGACSIATHLLLEDAGLEYEGIQVDWRNHPEQQEEYKKTVNPKGQVPALVIDGEVITEAPAVMTAVSQLAPNKFYTGSTPLENLRFYEWINFLSGSIHGKYFSALLRPEAFSAEASAADGIRGKARSNIDAGFKMIDDRLAALGSPSWALGDKLTGVDAELLVFWLWAKRFDIDLSKYKNYEKIYNSISQTAAFTSTMKKEGFN